MLFPNFVEVLEAMCLLKRALHSWTLKDMLVFYSQKFLQKQSLELILKIEMTDLLFELRIWMAELICFEFECFDFPWQAERNTYEI